MNTDLDCHPTTEILNDYIQGNLSTGLSVALSAHLELCKSCKQNFAKLESSIVNSWEQDSSEVSTNDFAHLVTNIVNQPQIDSDNSSVARQSPITKIHMGMSQI